MESPELQSCSTFTPTEVRALVELIVGREVAPGDWSFEDLCMINEWMHLNIEYVSDAEQYGQEEYVASPDETLRTRKGDCEDHVLLVGSFCEAIGLEVRTVLMPEVKAGEGGHAG